MNLGLLKPKEVLLGTEIVLGKKNKRHVGYCVPFIQNIKLISLPKVWAEIQNPRSHISEDYMLDICDGDIFNKTALFQINPTALQIILHWDDIETVNPIGSHTKKHKWTMVYFTLGNVSPHLRSALSMIQLVAIAKAKDHRDYGIGKLLSDFTSSVNKLASEGIPIEIQEITHNIQGILVLVSCDSLAASWLEVFKEGVSFAHKPCRTCHVTSNELSSTFQDSFERRDEAEHRENCDFLSTLS